MRIYKSCVDAVTDIGRELKKCSSEVHTQTMQNVCISNNKDFNTREIQGFCFAIVNTSDKAQMPNLTQEWCELEFKERVSERDINPGFAYRRRETVWFKFLNQDGRFDYTYGNRMQEQLRVNINELKAHPETRQCIIQIHNRKEDQSKMASQRVPCSMFYQFMLRNGKLDIMYIMRSADFVMHFQNDIYLAIRLQEHFAQAINKPIGKFIMFVSSLHIYQKDWEELKRY